MVKKLALSGLAALILAESGCVSQNYNLNSIKKLEVASSLEVPLGSMSRISTKTPTSWRVSDIGFTERNYRAVIDKEDLFAALEVNKFEDEEGAIKYLSKKCRGKKVSVKEDYIELSYKIKEERVGDFVLPGITKHYDLITRSKNLVFELNSLSTSGKEKRELRELLYSLVK